MKKEKPFKTIDEQIGILKERGLLFLNESAARDTLTTFGYYEIINGYKYSFLIDPKDDTKGFKPNTTFEHIFALFELDRKLRIYVLDAMERFEQSFKQALAYVIAGEISEKSSHYLAVSHYNTGKARRGRFRNEREFLLFKCNKVLKNENDPYKYYHDKYGNIPPWILVKGLQFGNAIALFKLSKPTIRNKVICRMTNIDYDLLDSIDEDFSVRQSFNDLLALFLNYRNIAAHGGRIYSHRTKKYKVRNSSFIYRKNFFIQLDENSNKDFNSSLGLITRALELFRDKNNYSELLTYTQVTLEQYLKKYPDDKDFLLRETQLKDTYIGKAINGDI
ncbi:Abi family protein [Pediococcus acidilactici]|uniref:Abi family protein n=1 Tax=Pediococcus acidilactici TaxID=1254 RepID=UPI00137BBC46|nr:Abi family protein [Pediococcus acidilactici]QHS03550.1 Abi family protein [Pediococcus acidilactici]